MQEKRKQRNEWMVHRLHEVLLLMQESMHLMDCSLLMIELIQILLTSEKRKKKKNQKKNNGLLRNRYYHLKIKLNG
jgi:uncharacterized membrane protein affecting hemolysin expression